MTPVASPGHTTQVGVELVRFHRILGGVQRRATRFGRSCDTLRFCRLPMPRSNNRESRIALLSTLKEYRDGLKYGSQVP